ncbi:MAG: hypothetical protein AABW88_05645 [Nanoarchaeota archaeon]
MPESLESTVVERLARGETVSLYGFKPRPLTTNEQKRFDEVLKFEERSWNMENYKNLRYD